MVCSRESFTESITWRLPTSMMLQTLIQTQATATEVTEVTYLEPLEASALCYAACPPAWTAGWRCWLLQTPTAGSWLVPHLLGLSLAPVGLQWFGLGISPSSGHAAVRGGLHWWLPQDSAWPPGDTYVIGYSCRCKEQCVPSAMQLDSRELEWCVQRQHCSSDLRLGHLAAHTSCSCACRGSTGAAQGCPRPNMSVIDRAGHLTGCAEFHWLLLHDIHMAA